MKRLVFNPEKCTGCRACELACSFFNDGVFSPARSRIRVIRIDEEGIDIPMGCYHCDNALCMLVCPSPLAMYRDKDTGAVMINVDACIGCRSCMLICPFGAINHDPEKGFCYKCDLCGGDPECVKWCFTKAIEYVDDEEYRRGRRVKVAEDIAKSLLEAARLVKPGKG